MATQGKQATMCNKMLFLAWNETWLQFFVVYTGKNIAFPICVWVQVFKPVALFQKWQWPFFTVTQTTLSGVSCAHGHKGKAAKCEVWPIMAYAHSGPMYLAFWPRRPAGCWFTSTARTVGVITKTYAVYKYKHRSDINTCQPEPQKGSNSLIKVSFLIKKNKNKDVDGKKTPKGSIQLYCGREISQGWFRLPDRPTNDLWPTSPAWMETSNK